MDAAQGAFAAWSDLLPQERAAILRRWFELMLAHKDDLARIMVLEQGKPLSEARGRDRLWRRFRRVLCRRGQAAQHRGRDQPSARCARSSSGRTGRRGRADHAVELPRRDAHPQGRRRARRGLHRGRHPAHETPYSALALAELAERAGFPAGRVQRRDRARHHRRAALDHRPAGAARCPSPARPRSAGCSTAQSPIR